MLEIVVVAITEAALDVSQATVGSEQGFLKGFSRQSYLLVARMVSQAHQ